MRRVDQRRRASELRRTSHLSGNVRRCEGPARRLNPAKLSPWHLANECKPCVLDLLALKTKRAPPTGFDCSRYPDWWIFISQLLNEVRGERWLGDGTPSRQPHIKVK